MLKFSQNGYNYTADEGWARADTKDGKVRWQAFDVFTKEPPTKEAVIALHSLFESALDKHGQSSEPSPKGKR